MQCERFQYGIACPKGVTAAHPRFAFRDRGSSYLTSSILAISAIYPLGGLFGSSSGRLVAVLAASEGLFGRSWPLLGGSWAVLWRSWLPLRPSWGGLGRSWAALGLSWRHAKRHWNRSNNKIDFKTDFNHQKGDTPKSQRPRPPRKHE